MQQKSETRLNFRFALDNMKAGQGERAVTVRERRTSTGNGLFALLSRDFEQVFGQIVSTRIKTLGNTNTVASRLIKREKGSLLVDVRRSDQKRRCLTELPNE